MKIERLLNQIIKDRFVKLISKDYKLYLTILAFFAIVITLTSIYLRHENYIYFWDQATYFVKYRTIDAQLSSQDKPLLPLVLQSINKDDYNLLPVVFLIPFRRLFGESRLAYIYSVIATYAFPSILLFILLIKTSFWQSISKSRLRHIYPLIIFLSLIPQFWIPILRGYTDVAGLIVTMALYILSFRILKENRILDFALAGLLLPIPIILRPWYMVWVVAYAGVLAGIVMVNSLIKKDLRLKNLLLSSRNVFLMLAFSISLFLFLSKPLLVRIISTNYSYIYSAYKANTSLYDSLLNTVDYIGPIYVLLSLAGVLVSLIDKKIRTFSLFIFLQTLASWAIFTKIQEPSIQHFYLILPAIIFFIGAFFIFLYKKIPSGQGRLTFVSVFAVFQVINYAFVFAPDANKNFSGLGFIAAETRSYPLQRSDIGEIDKLLETLDSLARNEGLVYVLSSSYVLNDQILMNRCLDYPEFGVCNKILDANHVDKRDGFPYQFYLAKYVVITEPVGYHLNPQEQKVVGILADELTKKRGIGLAFVKLPYEFELEENTKAYIFEKKLPITETDKNNLFLLFYKLYPDIESSSTTVLGKFIKPKDE